MNDDLIRIFGATDNYCISKFDDYNKKLDFLNYIAQYGIVRCADHHDEEIDYSSGLWIIVFVGDNDFYCFESESDLYKWIDEVGMDRSSECFRNFNDINIFLQNEDEEIMSCVNGETGSPKKTVRVAKTKQLQMDAAKIAAKIEVGKIANTQITNRIMKQINLPPFLVGYKKQIEPVIRLLVANGALIAADSLGVDNKKATFVLEAMQLAGTQEVFELVNINDIIDGLVGMIDPKMLDRAGIDDE